MAMARRDGAVLRQLGTLFNLGVLREATDGQLLERFATGPGESAELAFAALVERHGPMVLGVCRAILRDDHEAQDAFQATFLALSRKARALWVRDSIGPWLHQAACRAAGHARSARARRRYHERRAGVPVAVPVDDRDDLRGVLHEEIERLPARYRAVVVLCDLEGRTHDQAARHLGCPAGTVKSRLSRGRERLRARLVRRGLAPAIVAPVVKVPTVLAQATSRAAVGFLAGDGIVGTVPAAVVGLVGSTLRSMAMGELRTIAGVVALVFATTVGAVALVQGREDGADAFLQRGAASGVLPADGPETGEAPSTPNLAEQLERIREDYRQADRTYRSLYRGSTIPDENREQASEIRPDFPATVRSISDLAESGPQDPAVRDAWLWVINVITGYSDEGPFGAEFDLASDWLVRHFGDDPDAVRLGLDLSLSPSARRDATILRFFASAEGHESRGLARLALADLLKVKAMMAERSREVPGRRTITYAGMVAEDGTLYDKEVEQSDDGYAYLLQLKQCDVDYLRSEAERLYEEVIAEYDDVPYITVHQRQNEALLVSPEPKWNGEPLTEEGRERIERSIARRTTLGRVAERRLDDWFNLAVGKEAPEIEAETVDGEVMRLSDYRGKVVALTFWGSWCGPCVREIPRERALVERMEGRPFAMLGVNTDEDVEAARKAIEAEKVTWPNWFDGSPGDGPIARRYHIRSYPTVYVIDAMGIIRSKKAYGDSLDRMVETLVTEAEETTDDE